MGGCCCYYFIFLTDRQLRGVRLTQGTLLALRTAHWNVPWLRRGRREEKEEKGEEEKGLGGAGGGGGGEGRGERGEGQSKLSRSVSRK